jgi:hypothetical protein
MLPYRARVMPTLHSHLQDLAHRFADEVLSAIRHANLQELVSDSPRGARSRRGPGRPRRAHAGGVPTTPKSVKRGRLARRSPDDIAKTLAQVVSLVKGKKEGLSSEQIQKSLRLDRREVPRVLSTGLAKKHLRKKGQKRATRYFAG